MRFWLMAIVAALSLATGAMALDETNWSTDLEAAKAEAKKDGKDVFIFFAGTDWDEGSMKMATDIFDKKEFLDLVKKSYVLVLIDFPKNKKLAPELAAKNDALAKSFRSRGYPAVILMEGNGDVFAYLRGYQEMNVKEYFECISECTIIKMFHDKEMAAANSSVGAERAGHLSTALTGLGATGLFSNGSTFGYDKIITEIMALDPKNELHLKADWEVYLTMAPLEDALKSKDWPGAHKLADDMIAKYPKEPSLLQRMYAVKSFVYRNSDDQAKCIEYMQKCAEADPESELGQKAAQALDQLKMQEQMVPKN